MTDRTKKGRIAGNGVRLFIVREPLVSQQIWGYARIYCEEFMLRRARPHQKICWILFIGYLVMLTHFMFFSDDFGRSGHTEYAYNLVLFTEIKRFYRYRELLGWRSFLLNTVGNVACFMPFGFILPIISRRAGQWYNTILLSFLMSLGIETVQLTYKIGSFDVDDMFLNTLGGIAGYLCLVFVRMFRRRLHGASDR